MAELMRAEGLVREYKLARTSLRKPVQVLRAVDGVSLVVEEGRTLGLVGESGSGKSTLARLLLALESPDEGRILFRDRNLAELSGQELKRWRRDVQAIFQDPAAALPPRMRVKNAIREPLEIHRWEPKGESPAAYVQRLLSLVGLASAHGERYAHQLSGGQRQRVIIARALALEPALIVCDEPVSALDVSVQATVLNLLRSLKRDLHLTLVFISHDLGVVRYLADDVVVLYRGRVIEEGSSDQLFTGSRHPYTRALLAARPTIQGGVSQEKAVERPRPAGASAENGRPACMYAPRCPLATARCREERPALRELAPGQRVACHHAERVPEALRLRT